MSSDQPSIDDKRWPAYLSVHRPLKVVICHAHGCAYTQDRLGLHLRNEHNVDKRTREAILSVALSAAAIAPRVDGVRKPDDGQPNIPGLPVLEGYWCDQFELHHRCNFRTVHKEAWKQHRRTVHSIRGEKEQDQRAEGASVHLQSLSSARQQSASRQFERTTMIKFLRCAPVGRIFEIEFIHRSGHRDIYNGLKMPVASTTCGEKLHRTCIEKWRSYESQDADISNYEHNDKRHNDTSAHISMHAARMSQTALQGARNKQAQVEETALEAVARIVDRLDMQVQGLAEEIERLKIGIRQAIKPRRHSLEKAESDDAGHADSSGSDAGEFGGVLIGQEKAEEML